MKTGQSNPNGSSLLELSVKMSWANSIHFWLVQFSLMRPSQNEFNIKILKIIINNNFTNFIFCKIKILIVYFYVLKRLYKINYYSYIYIYFILF